LTKRITPVILSGGAGTRLWPLSTADRPKQLHALAGSATMLQMTAQRVAEPSRFTAPIVVAGTRHLGDIAAQLEQVGAQPLLTVLEPCGRNTAAAIALAALESAPEALLLVMPSDHVIGRPDAFHAAVAAAAPLAEQGHLVTFGIAPTRPETGYGYIERGAELGGGGWAVRRFVEKPDAQRAAEYLASGRFDWNGGIFLFRARDLVAGLELHAPDILHAVRASLAAARREQNCVYPDPDLFAAVRSQSIDYALLEPHDRVAVVPVDMDWSDLGSWDALYELAAKDAADNALAGPVAAAADTRGCLLHSSGPKVVTLGVEDLIVVATAEAVLVLPRSQSQRVREAVDALRKANPPPAGPDSGARPPPS
jgi:mannose-1-phosphate guanylyltransferase/mannose-1-phosphate guanylyltransferase/mannose-6-phosphate isomerase